VAGIIQSIDDAEKNKKAEEGKTGSHFWSWDLHLLLPPHIRTPVFEPLDSSTYTSSPSSAPDLRPLMSH
jgi:hypothetical protein